jgi:hypothetical protein
MIMTTKAFNYHLTAQHLTIYNLYDIYGCTLNKVDFNLVWNWGLIALSSKSKHIGSIIPLPPPPFSNAWFILMTYMGEGYNASNVLFKRDSTQMSSTGNIWYESAVLYIYINFLLSFLSKQKNLITATLLWYFMWPKMRA